VLLAPLKAMIGRSSTMAFSTSSMRTMLDSIATRLDESRDTSRYLVGLLVFLGLLGTFWGLLNTIGSIRETIESLDPGTGDAAAVLDSLKQGLSAPLSAAMPVEERLLHAVGQRARLEAGRCGEPPALERAADDAQPGGFLPHVDAGNYDAAASSATGTCPRRPSRRSRSARRIGFVR